MSHASSRARTLTLASLSAIAALGAASSTAQAVDFTLKASCKYPLVGVHPLELAVSADLPGSWILNHPTERFPIRTSTVSGRGTAEVLARENAFRVDGALDLYTHLEFPSGFVQGVLVPSEFDRWQRPTAGLPESIPLTAKGGFPELTLDETGDIDVFVDRLHLNLTAYGEAGERIRVREKVDYDIDGAPTIDSDGDPYTFDVYCKLDPPGPIEIATIESGSELGLTAPGQLKASPSLASVDLSWTASPRPFGPPIVGYDVTVGGETKRVTGTSASFAGLRVGTGYTATVVAVDGAGSRSAPATVTFQVPYDDRSVPTVPTDVNLTADDIGATFLNVRWGPSTVSSGVGIKEYRITWEDGRVATVPADARSYRITGLDPDSEYYVDISAVSNTGKESEPLELLLITRSSPPFARRYAVAGTSTIRTLTKGAVPVAGELVADPDAATTTTVPADLALKPTQARLLTLGFLPVTAKVAFVTNGRTALELANDDRLTTKSVVRIKLPEVKLFGAIPLAGGSNCQTKALSTIVLASTDAFVPSKGGRLAGTFAISDLNGCGVLNGLVSPLTAGGGNTIELSLTAQAGQ